VTLPPNAVPPPEGDAPADRLTALADEARRIGHDLNNCLGVVVGRAELARMHLSRGNEDGARKGIDVILSQTDRMRQLVDELRSLQQRV
jgi:nitrogen-specific signal transduction histidine kinase